MLSSTQERDFGILLHLKKVSWACLLSQAVAMSVILFCLVFFHSSQFSSVMCSWLAILVSLTPVFYAVSSRQFPVLFSCISVFNIAPIWFLYKDAVLPGSDTFVYSSPSLKYQALLYASLFQVFVNLFYVFFWKPGVVRSLRVFLFVSNIRLSRNLFIWLALVTFIGPLIAFYFYYGSFDILWLAVTGGRSGGGSAGGLLIQESIGNTSSYMLPINFVWQLTPLLGVIGFTSSKDKFSLFPVLSLLSGLLVVFAFFLSGSRGNMMFVAAPILFFFVFYNWNKGLRFWLPAIVLFVFTFAIMELQVRFRGDLLKVLADPQKAARIDGMSSVTTIDPTKANQENNMYLLCLIINGVPRKYQYEGFNDFFASLVNPIPRAIWPGKPLLNGAKEVIHQPGYILDGPVFMGTTSLTYSVVGEAYLANGVFGLLVYSLVYVLFILCFDGVCVYATGGNVLAVGLLGMSMFLAFWGYRSFFALVTFMYPLALFILFLWILHGFSTNPTYSGRNPKYT